MNRDGEVRKWAYDLPKSELRPEQITPETIESFSPLPKPPLSRQRVAQVLIVVLAAIQTVPDLEVDCAGADQAPRPFHPEVLPVHAS